jgi:hypothetical protein
VYSNSSSDSIAVLVVAHWNSSSDSIAVLVVASDTGECLCSDALAKVQ